VAINDNQEFTKITMQRRKLIAVNDHEDMFMSNVKRIGILFLLIYMAFTNSAIFAQQDQLGILSRPAPPWSVTDWINLPNPKTSLEVDDYRGKVLYLFFFQSW
jgi:hypothetical protein